MVSTLCLCVAARPRNSLVADEDVKKPTKQTHFYTSTGKVKECKHSFKHYWWENKNAKVTKK